MITYTVDCQDASGRSVQLTVRAETDEKACAAALVELNSWRAVRALAGKVPSTLVGSDGDGHGRHRAQRVPEKPAGDAGLGKQSVAPPSDPTSAHGKLGPKVLHKAGPRDWIEMRGSTGRIGAVGEALRRAAVNA